jgi:hypothetical protein
MRSQSPNATFRISSYLSNNDTREFNQFKRDTNVHASIVAETDFDVLNARAEQAAKELKQKVLRDFRTLENYKNSMNGTLRTFEELQDLRRINENLTKKSFGKRMIANLNSMKANNKQYADTVDNLTNEAFALLVPEIAKNFNYANMKAYTGFADKFTDSLTFDQINERDNFVMKICNELDLLKLAHNTTANTGTKGDQQRIMQTRIQSGGQNNDSRLKSVLTKQSSITRTIQMEPNAYVNVDQNSFSMANLNTAEVEEQQKSIAYFDAKYEKKGFKYRYAKVLDHHFEEIIDKYDGSQPVEVTIKQNLPLYDYYQALTIDTPNSGVAIMKHMRDMTFKDPDSTQKLKKIDKSLSRPRSIDQSLEFNIDFQTYAIFKRLMVKRKYEAATLKYEKAADKLAEKKKRRTTMVNPTLPAINPLLNRSATPQSAKSMKSYRNAEQQHQVALSTASAAVTYIKPFPEDDDEELQNFANEDEYVLDNVRVRCVTCNRLVKSDNSNFEYDNFSINFETMKKSMTDETILPVAQLSKDISEMAAKTRIQCDECEEFQAKTVTHESTTKPNYIGTARKTAASMTITDPLTGTSGYTNKVDDDDRDTIFSSDNQFATELSSMKTSGACVDAGSNGNEHELNISLELKDEHLEAIKLKKREKNLLKVKEKKDKSASSHGPKCRHHKKMSLEETIQYQRKIDLLPSKSFTSQRKQSISSNSLTLMKIREKEKKAKQRAEIEAERDDDLINPVCFKNYSIANQEPIVEQQQTELNYLNLNLNIVDTPRSSMQALKKFQKLVSKRPRTAVK